MDYSELCRIKDKLLLEVKKNIRPDSFVTHEAYQLHIDGIEEGVLRFFTQSMLELIEKEETAKPKRAA